MNTQEKISDEIMNNFEFRTIKQEEAKEAAKTERICFPPHEACTEERMTERIKAASDLFMVAIDRNTGKIAGFLNGIATDEYWFKDEFFTDIKNHDPDGNYIMIMGLDVVPEYRMKGLGRALIYNYCEREKARGRKKLVLTCLEDKVKMYSKFGFSKREKCASKWGGEEWYEMDISLNN